MINGYYLRGVEQDYCFVVKTDDPEVILRLIQRLCRTRDKDLRELGEQLEKDWNNNERGIPQQIRPKDKKEIYRGKRSGGRKAADS